MGASDGSDGRTARAGGDQGGQRAGAGDDEHGELSLAAAALLARDLLEPEKQLSEEEVLRAQLPAVEPEVRNMYGERPRLAPIGYSEKTMNTVIVPLSKKKYPEFEQAAARMQELLELRKLKVVGHPFYDARNWVWECIQR